MTYLVKMFLKESKENPYMTVDEFYDKYGVSKECRTDYGTACMVRQARGIQ